MNKCGRPTKHDLETSGFNTHHVYSPHPQNPHRCCCSRTSCLNEVFFLSLFLHPGSCRALSSTLSTLPPCCIPGTIPAHVYLTPLEISSYLRLKMVLSLHSLAHSRQATNTECSSNERTNVCLHVFIPEFTNLGGERLTKVC